MEAAYGAGFGERLLLILELIGAVLELATGRADAQKPVLTSSKLLMMSSMIAPLAAQALACL